MTRPQWLDAPIVQTSPSRDLLLAVDVSYSMQIKDMTLNGQSIQRLDMVKSYLQSFIKQRTGDRVGVILFADHAYLMIPFTQDLQATGQLLDEVNIGLAGKFTAIGEAITLAVKRTLHEQIKNKTLILLSDGRDTVNTISPIDAAGLAKASGLKIYTVGIGADPTEAESQSDLDETTLEQIAQITGGQYFRARSEQDLSEIYQHINLIEPLSLKTVTYQPYTELLIWPLSCLLIVIAMLLWGLRND
jgi:Ca-activated chloride channel family protein